LTAITPIYPAALRAGDTMAIVAPSGPVDVQRLERARTRLAKRGFRVRVPDHIGRSRGYLAGDDALRADELMAAFLDNDVRAVVPARGGYGVTRILNRLDFDAIRSHPKILTGFSDITALHLAVQKRTGLITFHSPHPMDGWGSPAPPSALTDEAFWQAVLVSHDEQKPNEGDGYSLAMGSYADGLTALRDGVARGRLTGGNLSLVAALLGTPFEIETEGRILFLEEVDERPYRIDRYLSQLKLAGKLDAAAGVLLGHFSGCHARADKPSLPLDDVLQDYLAALDVPVLAGIPAGHHFDNITLPLNCTVEMDTGQRRVTVCEDPVRPANATSPNA